MKLIFVVYIQQPNATTQVISAVVDYRGSSSLPITNYVPTAHSSLTGLIAPADDHTQYVLDGGATSTSGHLAMYTDTSGRTVNDSGLLTASLKYDYINFDESNFVVYTPLSQGGTGAELSTEQLSNGIERVIYTFDHSHLQQVFFSADMPPEWDGGNVTFEMFWETADANLNTGPALPQELPAMSRLQLSWFPLPIRILGLGSGTRVLKQRRFRSREAGIILIS